MGGSYGTGVTPRRSLGVPRRPRGVGQPPARCRLVDSPTATHADIEVQLTDVSDWGEPTTAAPFQTEPGVPVSLPVRIEIPASGKPGHRGADRDTRARCGARDVGQRGDEAR